MDTREHAAEIRKALKKLGWGSREVSVRIDRYSLGSSIRVIVKSARVPLSKVREIANAHEHVRRCDYTGEVLSGGNMYVDADYSREALSEIAAPLAAQLATVEATPGTSVDVGYGWRAAIDREGFWHAFPSEYAAPSDVVCVADPVKCWGRDFCARQLAERFAELEAA